MSTGFIDFFAKIGWAYEREYQNDEIYIEQNVSNVVVRFHVDHLGKSVSPEMVAKRAARCGDGTYNLSEQDVHENAVWGYGDKDLHVEDIQELQ